MQNRRLSKSYQLLKKTLFITSLLIISSLIVCSTATARSDIMIRVGLLFNSGSHQEAVNYVTLSSPDGLEVFVNNIDARLDIYPNEEIIGNLDSYSLLVESTSDINHAQTIHNNLRNKSYMSVIVINDYGESRNYRVLAGNYSDYNAAASAQSALLRDLGYNSKIEGTYRVQAGVFSDYAQAREEAAVYANSAVSVELARCIENGELVYKVWLGREINEDVRQNLLAELVDQYPDKEFFANPASDEYLIARNIILANKEMQQILFPAGQAKIKITGIEAGIRPGLVKINERGNRYYRGVIELSMYNGKLAVINELLMDYYLYGVVPREMASGWPMEALKAQAVIARTYALGKPENNWGIARVVDDVKDQAYWGYSMEAADTNQAVDETSGEVLRIKANNNLAATFYSSNMGGITAEGIEVWGNDISYLQSVDSSYDRSILDRINMWYHVMLSNGDFGYIRSDFIDLLNQYNAAGYQMARINENNVNIRSNADTYHTAIRQSNKNEMVTIIDKVYENNAYSWSKGPYDPVKMQSMINKNQRSANPTISSPVMSLEVIKRGPSGRVMEVAANGKLVSTSSPDAHRALFQDESSLRSTLFEIDNRGSYTILSANGQVKKYPENLNVISLYALTGDNVTSNNNQAKEVNNKANHFMIIDKEDGYRIASKKQEFVFYGKGYGHGFGLSQWGAYGMALAEDNGGRALYDYADILYHYYSNDVYLSGE